jgi:hypothetical protein
MLAGGWISAIAWLWGGACSVTPATAVHIEGRLIRIADIVDEACLEGGATPDVADLIIAEFPDNADEIAISRAGLMALASRRAPGLTFMPTANDTEIVTLRTSTTEKVEVSLRCFNAGHALIADQIVTRADLVPAPCAPRPSETLLYFERTHNILRAATDIAPGTHIGRALVPAHAYDTGDKLSLVIAIGAVRIERDVWALQPSSNGDNIFVEDENGLITRSPTLNPYAETTHDQE